MLLIQTELYKVLYVSDAMLVRGQSADKITVNEWDLGDFELL